MDTDGGGKDRVKTADTLLDIIEHISRENGATITEIADSLGYAKSTVHRHLVTLEAREYVVRESNTYRVGFRFLEFGEQARTRRHGYRLAREKVDELAAETDERAQFLVEEHGSAVYVHRAVGEHAVHTDPGIGRQVPLYSISAGKAILAAMDEEAALEMIEQFDFEPMTDHTITDREELLADLERIRERGYAINDEENIEGLRAVGAPVTGIDGGVLGAISVSGPKPRMRGDWFEEELPDILLGAANEIELNVSYS